MLITFILNENVFRIYFVNFTYKDEIMEADPDVTLLPCEWVVKADSKEEAIEQIKKDMWASLKAVAQRAAQIR